MNNIYQINGFDIPSTYVIEEDESDNTKLQEIQTKVESECAEICAEILKMERQLQHPRGSEQRERYITWFTNADFDVVKEKTKAWRASEGNLKDLLDNAQAGKYVDLSNKTVLLNQLIDTFEREGRWNSAIERYYKDAASQGNIIAKFRLVEKKIVTPDPNNENSNRIALIEQDPVLCSYLRDAINNARFGNIEFLEKFAEINIVLNVNNDFKRERLADLFAKLRTKDKLNQAQLWYIVECVRSLSTPSGSAASKYLAENGWGRGFLNAARMYNPGNSLPCPEPKSRARALQYYEFDIWTRKDPETTKAEIVELDKRSGFGSRLKEEDVYPYFNEDALPKKIEKMVSKDPNAWKQYKNAVLELDLSSDDSSASLKTISENGKLPQIRDAAKRKLVAFTEQREKMRKKFELLPDPMIDLSTGLFHEIFVAPNPSTRSR